ncbi:hypothetical protein [Nocardioides sp.]|uniref:hypothetical protein n=1 Tax=Nocardioides sp. TaxID=35761 RepID=UPI00286E7EA3|nr:hypothetical protein [Nocardioides sp.]
MVIGTVLVACGAESGQDTAQKQIGGAAPADLSTCADDAVPAATTYGDGFPSDWPFPSNTVVHHVEDRGADGTIVSAISTTSFSAILEFLNRDAVDAGFKIEDGETEDHDAEAEWKGDGFHGRWTIRESATCAGETVIQVLSTAD